MLSASMRVRLIQTASRRIKLASRRLSTAPPDKIVKAPVRSIWRNEGLFVRVGIAATVVPPLALVVNPVTIGVRVEKNIDDFFQFILSGQPEDDKIGRAIVGVVAAFLLFPLFGVPYCFVKTIADVAGGGLVVILPVYGVHTYFKGKAPQAWSRAMTHLGKASCVGVLTGVLAYIAFEYSEDNAPVPETSVLRYERPNGEVWHLEGAKGAERKVRVEMPNGKVQHFEGKKGAERLVRTELPAAADRNSRTGFLMGTITLGMIAAAVIVVVSGEK